MNCDMEAEDRPFTTVTYKKARPAGIPIIFKLTDPGASFWKVNPNKLASEVVAAAKKNVQSFRVNRDGNFSDRSCTEVASMNMPLKSTVFFCLAILTLTLFVEIYALPYRYKDSSKRAIGRNAPTSVYSALQGLYHDALRVFSAALYK
ncbi:hypothetical protein MTO96_026882 [Rhipicephalus appendiculatus]